MDDLIRTHRRLARGASLYRAGDEFSALYAVRDGFLKTVQTLEGGREQVTGFHMAGELLGMDGIGPDAHSCDAVALEESHVCVIPYLQLAELGREVHGLLRQFHKAMSQEIVQRHSVMLLLGTMRAEERLATFLLDLRNRFMTRRGSSAEFNLRMTREEIGSYLGLRLETVSRTFSKFHDHGFISVAHKHVHILDVAALQGVMAGRLTAQPPHTRL